MLPSVLFAATNAMARDLGLPELTVWHAAAGTPHDAEEATLAAIEVDSRQVNKGSLFVALCGATANGHDFLERAMAHGATVLLIQASELDDHIATLTLAKTHACAIWVSPDTRATLAPLCHTFFGHPLSQVHLVGITGTNGKSTSTWMIRQVLESCGIPTGLIGTLGYIWQDTHIAAANTTPDPLTLCRLVRRMVTQGVRVVAMEVSSHALSNGRLWGVQFDHVAFTNLTQDHLDYHGTMDAYRRAKWLLFSPRHLKAGGQATINRGNAQGRLLLGSLEDSSASVESFALEDSDATWWATDIKADAHGTHFMVHHGVASQPMWSPMVGAFNVENALIVAAVVHHLGISLAQVGQGLGAMRPVPGRMSRVPATKGPVAFVDYAHTPDALEHALKTLRPLTGGQLIVVFGCGGNRDHTKRPLMGKAARQHADCVVVTSDNPRHEAPEAILDAIEAGVRPPGPDWHRQPERAKAIALALTLAREGDVVLIAGKGHETYQEIAGNRVHFDDMEEASACLEQWS